MTAYTLHENADLRDSNTLRVAAKARFLAEVTDAAALPELLATSPFPGLPVMALGEGSNLLLVDDYPGLMLRLRLPHLSLREDADSALVRAEAGAGWDALVSWTLARGLAGLENLALIPGLVGAAPIQNIGAYGVEVGEFIESVEAYDRREARLRRLGRDDCAFAYRDSVFKHEPERWLVTAIELRLPRGRALQLGYAGVGDELQAMGIDRPDATTVAEAVRRLRRRKLPDPAVIGNAGSFFKNPLLASEDARQLKLRHAGLPVYPTLEATRSKLSAAWLIDSCGWRGHREGDAGISAQHALVLVNHGNASGRELLALARRIAQSVFERYGVRLEPEPRIVGAAW